MKPEREAAIGAETKVRSWTIAEALAAHLEGSDACTSGFGLSDEERDDLRSLAHVAGRLDARMRPLRPSPAFVQSLGDELVREAGRRLMRREKHRRVAVISAAVAGGLVSIASLVGGIVVLVKWLRTRSEARYASTA